MKLQQMLRLGRLWGLGCPRGQENRGPGHPSEHMWTEAVKQGTGSAAGPTGLSLE